MALIYDLSFVFSDVVLVPVYDCRNAEFDFSKDLEMLETFPRWRAEIDEGSCIAVAYTISKFMGKRGVSVGFNLQWIALLGVPE